MLTPIAGRSVIVTGASKGIGKGIAKVFAENGGKVLVVSRHLDEAEACAEELRRAGGTAKGHAADVTKIADMQAMAAAAVTAHGGIDILCANAGIFPDVFEPWSEPKTFVSRPNKATHWHAEDYFPNLRPACHRRISSQVLQERRLDEQRVHRTDNHDQNKELHEDRIAPKDRSR